MNVNSYNYINGAFTCSNVGSKYTPFGSNVDDYHGWLVQFESVKASGQCILAQHLDRDGDGWEVGINQGNHPYVYWSRNSEFRGTYVFSVTAAWNSWVSIKFELPTSGSPNTLKCTVGSDSSTVTASGRWNNNYDRNLRVGSNNTSIRGVVTVKGYAYNSNSLQTATFNLDNMSVGATQMSTNGNTFSMPAVQHYDATYTVQYNSNGGSGTIASDTKTYNVALTLPSSGFTKTGYHMTGWRKDSTSGEGYALGGSYTGNADATFYAAWTLNEYYVRFNANGGTGSMSNETFTYGQSKALTANAFTKSGYRFAGWATSPDGDVVYTDGETVSNLTGEDSATVDLYAVWETSGVRVKHNGEWKTGIAYVKVNGEWTLGQVYAKNNGTWKAGE